MDSTSTPPIGEPLVEVLARCARLDTSLVRRAVVEGKVTVNDAVVTDPAARVHSEDPSFIGYGEHLYPYYPNDAFSSADIVFELVAYDKTTYEEVKLDQHGTCPACGSNWDAGDMFPVLRKQSCFDKLSDDELRQKITIWYSPPYKFSRLIGVEYAYDHPQHYDGVSEWACPDCDTRWYRFQPKPMQKSKA